MGREADLNPSLGMWGTPGHGGGPCLVVERIEDTVRNDSLRHDLAEKVEHGKKLTNPEAAVIYKMDRERGAGVFKAILIPPHAQYRMDQRGITVVDLRLTLANYSKKLNDWKSQKSWEWDDFEQSSRRGEPIEWMDKKLQNLQTIFVNDRGVARIVSTYWKGMSDPSAGMCGTHPRHARSVEDMSGYQTYTKKPTPQKSDTGEGSDGKYPTQGLPSPPWSKSKGLGPQMFNVPGESGSNSDGNIHKDKARTQAVPGGQYDGGATHPSPSVTDTGITPKRRPGMTADGWDEDEDYFDDMDPAMVAAAVRMAGYKPRFTAPHPPGNMRERKQKGRAYLYFHKRYNRIRGKAKRLVKRRYNRLKNNGRFKMRREKARERPERHERRPGGGPSTVQERSQKQRDKAKGEKKKEKKKDKKATMPIPFFHYPTETWGEVIEVSPYGAIHFSFDGERGVAEFGTFFDEVVIEEEWEDRLFSYMDQVFGFSEGDDAGDLSEDDDPVFESWVTGETPKVAYNGFKLRRRPEKRRRKQRGIDKLKAKTRYRNNRMKSRVNSKKRYKRLKKNPQFKKQQAIRRKNPERFKMRRADVLVAPEIAFVLEQGGELLPGHVRNVSGMTGLVHFYLNAPGQKLLRSLPARSFLEEATCLSDEDDDALYALIDAEIGLEAYGDAEVMTSELINLYTIGSGFPHPLEKRQQHDLHDELLVDPSDDDFYYGAVVKLSSDVIGSFYRETEPPKMDPDTVYDRADDNSDRKRQDRKPGDVSINGPHEEEVTDSNPGSRVLPGDKGHVEKKAFTFRGLPRRCQVALAKLVKTPLWKRATNRGLGGGTDREVLAWLNQNEWPELTLPGLHDLVDRLFHARTAALIGEIREGCGSDIVARSEGLSFRLARVDRKNAVWLFDVQGSKGAHRVRLKAIRRGNVRDMRKAHVKVSCSCPFWQWQGPEFHAKQGDYLYGKPRGLATKPGVKDPSGKHMACKHVLAVLSHVTSNTWSVPMPRKTASGLHYLADTLAHGEMVAAFPAFEKASRRVAARYLASLAGGA